MSEFPALPAGPPPAVTRADWAFSLTTEDGLTRRWDWAAFRALPSQRIGVDLHCVTGWSVPASRWEATSVHHVVCGIRTSAPYVVVHSYAGHTTNVPLEDLVEMPAWLAFSRDGHELTAGEGGPARGQGTRRRSRKAPRQGDGLPPRSSGHPQDVRLGLH